MQHSRTGVTAAFIVRRTLGTLLAMALCGAASSGCRDASSPPGSAPATAQGTTPKVLKVALLHPGRENDRGWNQLAYEALMALEGRPGIAVKHAFSASESSYKSDMRAFAQQGYGLVICHGGEYVKAAKDVAREFPGTRFVVTGSDEPGDGVATLDFRLWEATYLCGVLAASLVPEGPAGLIGGKDFRTVRYTLDAFANGARSVKPDYQTYMQYVGSWDDVAKAAQTARSLIEGQKVRAVFQNCDAAAFGVFQAAREANVVAFGCNSNQNDTDGRVAASAVIDMALAFEQLVAMVRDGRFRAEAIVHDLASGGVKLIPNLKAAGKWPAGTRARLDSAIAAIKSGKLRVVDTGGAPR